MKRNVMFDFKGGSPGFRAGWFLLLGLALLFAFLYLRYSLFPGGIDPSVKQYFPLSLAEKARAFNFPLRVLYIVQFVLEVALLGWLLLSSKGRSLYSRIRKVGRHYWSITALSVISVWILVQLVTLPFSYYGYYWLKIWGFSTQSLGAWLMDYGKNAGIDLLITLVGGLIFFALVNRASRYWWVVGAAFFGIWLVVEYLFWPILISPLFNHFVPISDPGTITMINTLAQRAGLHINGIFVMDASKQTTLANAYFTGIGSSKRIVIYDTLLHNYSLSEIQAVLAHEMGHWKHGDVIHGLIAGVLGGFIVCGLLAFFLKPWLPKINQKPPELWAALQLTLLLLLFVSNPIQNAISRKMELRADSFSLQLTGNLSAEIQLQKDLAGTSLADLSPPNFIVWFSYDHPPVLTRIHALETEYYRSSASSKK
ncbi:M48 family metallopeptidase [Desulfosporosinus sp. PR]|uniref:M48 family metallopeptidase n=1 Tax=Candidatus Desulfosporosinus nitrosoreducens TaxID=3401928 RepID=UPI0027EE03F3|nr:M48 family metallopeptidase [Desulfosporosinus sp. PR]MDQ7097157.1 M48 family metallopeptidase [Desulfosporosinus sp. PR]